MSNKMRWRYGDTNPVMAKPDEDAHIEIGDLVFQFRDRVYPAQVLMEEGYDPETLKKHFMGVAMQESKPGQTAPIRIATTGVFEFEWPEVRRPLGTMVHCAGNQSVWPTMEVEGAIGRVARIVEKGEASVLVDIVSTVMKGGVR